MKQIKVSIILPSKNVKDYVSECLESVINQSLKEIEIICVDANSTDGTREIIEKYMQRDPRIQLLDDTKGSCGYAYNIGIAAAKGNYVGFVETDDYVSTNMFEKLYAIAESNNLDYVKVNHINFIDLDGEHFFEEEKIFNIKPYEKNYGVIINPSKYPEVNWFDHCMWNGIYKNKFLKENNIKLNESKGASYQDHGFQWQTMLKARRVMYIDDAYYYYRNDNTNASMKNLNGIVKDYGEFIFVKDIITKMTETTLDHMMVFYDKLFYTLRRWIELYQKYEIDLNDEQITVIEKWIAELKNGEEYLSPKLIGIEKYCELQLLINDYTTFCKYIKNEIISKKDYVKKLIERLHGKKIIIFGCGIFGKRLYALLKKIDDICVICFCDNNAHENEDFMGTSVYKPEYVVDKYVDAYYIIANQRYYLDCMRQLLELGVDKSKITYYEMTSTEFDFF